MEKPVGVWPKFILEKCMLGIPCFEAAQGPSIQKFGGLGKGPFAAGLEFMLMLFFLSKRNRMQIAVHSLPTRS